MNQLPIFIGKPVERERVTIFPLAVMVGYLTFLVCGLLPGGMSNVQGFFFGFTCIILLYVILASLARRQAQAKPTDKPESGRSNVLISQTEDEQGITIHIHVNKQSVLDQITING